MKKKDIKIGSVYAMKVSGNVVPVKVVGIRTVSGYNGRDKTIYACVNQKTGRDCKAESAAKFRYEIKFNEQPATLPMVKPEETLPELYDRIVEKLQDAGALPKQSASR